jgi:hypothetical protein
MRLAVLAAAEPLKNEDNEPFEKPLEDVQGCGLYWLNIGGDGYAKSTAYPDHKLNITHWFVLKKGRNGVVETSSIGRKTAKRRLLDDLASVVESIINAQLDIWCRRNRRVPRCRHRQVDVIVGVSKRLNSKPIHPFLNLVISSAPPPSLSVGICINK